MIINALEQYINFVPSFENSFKKLQANYHQIEVDIYTKLLKITRDINELSGLILEVNDLKLELNLQEFDGLL
jgi:hypothetical protein